MAKLTNFQEDIEKHLIDFKSHIQYLPPTSKKKWLYHDIADNLFPPIKHGFLQYVYDSGMPLHDFINHVRSSQMFCINLFYHLIKNEPEVIIKLLSSYSQTELINIVSFEFEYSSDSNSLGEWRSDGNRPEEYVTATDLFLRIEDNNSKVASFLLEIKFTENDFTSCGGYTSKGNSKNIRTVCDSGKMLLNDFQACYLQGANNQGKLKRRYLDYFEKAEFVESAFTNKCPFITNHQCIRNHALLRAIIKNKIIDYGYFVLVHHDKNIDIQNEWNDYKNILNCSVQKEIFKVKAGEFVNGSKDVNYKKYFKDKYKIN